MIAPMKKVSIVCMKDERDCLLSSLQRSELIMITSSEEGELGQDTQSAERARRAEQLIRELSKYKKKGLLEQKPEVDLQGFEKPSTDGVAACEEIEKKIADRESLKSKISALEARREEFRGFENLSHSPSDLKSSKYAVITTGRVPVLNFLQDDSLPLDVQKISENEKFAYLLLSYMKDDENQVREILSGWEFEEIALPFTDKTVGEECELIEKEIETLKERQQTVAKEIADAAACKDEVELAFEQFRASSDRSEIRLSTTRETVLIEGFIREDSKEALEKAVSDAVEVYALDVYDPEPDDEVPTSLTNGKLVSQFETITDMFNPPKYGDFDPNAVMAPWYWIIFGMMMGDAGYGLMMAVLIFLANKIMKPKGNSEKLFNVLFYSSFTTIIFGVLFGSYFGEELIPSVLPFTAMEDPVKMLLLTIIIGVLHIFTGMITKIVLNVREGKVLDAIFDQLSWMLIIAGIGGVFIKPLQTVGIAMMALGALIVLFTAGREKKGVVGKAVGGLVGLYGITSYFSDILSYSRILALGLATGVVGMVMNMLAGMVQGSVIGFILSLLIYVVGHVFNLALGLLSAYVHACRLQYIEFYGKFYEGGGKPFNPFKIRTNYINIKKD